MNKLLLIALSGLFCFSTAPLSASDENPVKSNQVFAGFGTRVMDKDIRRYSSSSGPVIFNAGYSRNIAGGLFTDLGISLGGSGSKTTTNGKSETQMITFFEPYAGLHYSILDDGRRISPFAEAGVKYLIMRIKNNVDYNYEKTFKKFGEYAGLGLSINFKYAKIMPSLQYTYIPITIHGSAHNAGGFGIMIKGVFMF